MCRVSKERILSEGPVSARGWGALALVTLKCVNNMDTLKKAVAFQICGRQNKNTKIRSLVRCADLIKLQFHRVLIQLCK